MKRKDIHHAEAERSIAEHAAEWLVTLKDPATPHARKEDFVAWLRRSPVHVEEFLRVSSLDGALFGRHLGIDADALVAQCRNTVSIPELRSRNGRIGVQTEERVKRWPRFSLAAAPSLALSTLALLTLIALAATVWVGARSTSLYATQRGEQRSVALPDGSLMELNTDTHVQVAYRDDLRRIVLRRGEALFTVAKSSDRPFVVEVGAHTVRATGTRFSVSELSARTIVTVIEGSVAVASLSSGQASSSRAGGEEVDLSVGQQFDSAAPAPAQVRSVDPRRALAWQEWKLHFDNVSLGEAVRELNRYNRRQLRIVDAALAERRISGVFFANQPDSLVAFIGSRDPIEVSEDRDGSKTVKLKR